MVRSLADRTFQLRAQPRRAVAVDELREQSRRRQDARPQERGEGVGHKDTIE